MGCLTYDVWRRFTVEDSIHCNWFHHYYHEKEEWQSSGKKDYQSSSSVMTRTGALTWADYDEINPKWYEWFQAGIVGIEDDDEDYDEEDDWEKLTKVRKWIFEELNDPWIHARGLGPPPVLQQINDGWNLKIFEMLNNSTINNPNNPLVHNNSWGSNSMASP